MYSVFFFSGNVGVLVSVGTGTLECVGGHF